MMKWILLVVILLLVLLWSYKVISTYRKNKRKSNKVISLPKRSRPSSHSDKGKQPCSFCRKKMTGLAFYADENGRVVGVCSQCKPHAERRALMRL